LGYGVWVKDGKFPSNFRLKARNETV